MRLDDYIPGVMAGASAALITHPLDVLKVRSQLVERQAVRISVVYVGLSAALMREILYTGTRLPVYTSAKQYTNKVAAGATAGVIGTCLAHPLDLVKVVKVCTPLKASNTRIMVNLIRNGQCMKGVTPALQRSILFSSVQLSTFDSCKEWLLDQEYELDARRAIPISAWLAGCASTLTSTPFDVVKTRVMAGKGVGSFACMRKIVKDEGIRALWRGGWLTWLRLGPYTFVQMTVWEYSLSFMRRQ